MIARSRLSEIRRAAAGRRVAVIGDLMLDEFLNGTVERISPEAPVPVLTYRSHHHVLGGAGNGARTLAALDASAVLVGLVGADPAGATVVSEAESLGIDASGIVVTPRRSTTQKTRVIAQTQHVVRIDRESSGDVGTEARRALERASLAAIETADAVVVSDYDKGALLAPLAQMVVAACIERDIPCIVDSKAIHAAYRGATLLTPNVGELAKMARMHLSSESDLDRAAESVLRRQAPRALLVTRSEEGMSLYVPGRARVDVPALATEVRDVTGAGDTVAAVVALGLAAGLDLTESAHLATLAAAVVVRKVGTAAPSWDEISVLAEG